MKPFRSLVLLFVALVALAVIGTGLWIETALSQSSEGGVFIGQFTNRSLALHVDDVGPFLGFTDVEVQHPFWVSNRPASGEVRDPTNPVDIANAWTTDLYTNMKKLDGTLVEGATILQEWIAVSPDEGIRLQNEGFATIGSSGSFVFGLIRQTASTEATAAFGIRTIDDGEFIRNEDTVQGICG